MIPNGNVLNVKLISIKKQIREQNMNSREIDVRGYNG
jgi:hypothetical protein